MVIIQISGYLVRIKDKIGENLEKLVREKQTNSVGRDKSVKFYNKPLNESSKRNNFKDSYIYLMLNSSVNN